MSDTPPLSPSGETVRLHARVAELVAANARLREAAAARDELADAQLAAARAQLAVLAARVEDLERRLGKDGAGRGAVPASSQARRPRR